LNLRISAVPQPASESRAGTLKLATQAEVNAGTVTDKAVTPAGLAGAHALAHRGTATIDFGSTPSQMTTVDVTGQTGIQASSDVQVWIQGTDSTDGNNAYMHAVMPIKVAAESIVAGTGFTIRASSFGFDLTGTYTVRWRWFD
jgi:hypothetical protein